MFKECKQQRKSFQFTHDSPSVLNTPKTTIDKSELYGTSPKFVTPVPLSLTQNAEIRSKLL